VSAAPEGGATLSALRKLQADGLVKPDESVVLFNTGGALKYLDVLGLGLGARDSGLGTRDSGLGARGSPFPFVAQDFSPATASAHDGLGTLSRLSGAW